MGDVVAVDLDQLQPARAGGAGGHERGLGQRLSPVPRTPQSSTWLAGRARGEAAGVLDQKVAHPVDAAQERDVDAVDALDGGERAAVGAPDEGFGRVEIGRGAEGGASRSSASAMRAEEGVIELEVSANRDRVLETWRFATTGQRSSRLLASAFVKRHL